MAPRKTAAQPTPVADEPVVDPMARALAEHENDTLVIEPGAEFTADQPTLVREPTLAERDAIKDHLELRLAELATYVRAEAHKHGLRVGEFGDHLADALRAMLAND